MRLLPVLLFLMLTATGFAQTGRMHVFTKDSVHGSMLHMRWLFFSGDNKALAAPAFDDRQLPEVNTVLFSSKDTAVHFKGIAWLRFHFRLDTSLLHQALALELSQNGASELYLDGKLIYTAGTIGNKRSSVYEDPHEFPVTLAIPDTLEHIFALRYANWNFDSRNPVFLEKVPGFTLALYDADSAIYTESNTQYFLSATCFLLTGIFGTLALLHGLFFLYYRQERSNLLFSLFCGSMALLFFAPFLNKTIADPTLIFSIDFVAFFIVLVACNTLSGFLNTLFTKRRRVLQIITVLCLVAAVLHVIRPSLNPWLLVIVISLVTIEAIVVIVVALIRKAPGSAIIGGGLALFVLLLLIVMVKILLTGNDSLVVQGDAGFYLFLIVCLAILSIPISFSAFLARGFAAVSRSLKLQLEQVRALSQKTLEQEAEKQRLLQSRSEELEQEVTLRTAEVMRQKSELEAQHGALKNEKKKTDDLLLNILPEEVAEELKEKGSSGARYYEQVTVLFTDFVDFTQHSERLSPTELVAEINECFTAFDSIIEQHGLEKIKTVGDAYIAVAGLPVTDDLHARHVVAAACDIRDYMLRRKAARPDTFDIRLGVHSGPVVAGIVGLKKFAYDIWGDTVNTAARMEQASIAGKINISAATYALVKETFHCMYRGEMEAKHKGRMGMYFVEEVK